jgi:hypothetical protein
MTAVCITYVTITRMTGEVYDPIWMIISGFLEGYPSASIFGALVCGILIPGMFCWLWYRHAFSFVVSAVCLIVWFVFCVVMREAVCA